jgi:hypothetical protein
MQSLRNRIEHSRTPRTIRRYRMNPDVKLQDKLVNLREDAHAMEDRLVDVLQRQIDQTKEFPNVQGIYSGGPTIERAPDVSAGLACSPSGPTLPGLSAPGGRSKWALPPQARPGRRGRCAILSHRRNLSAMSQ